MTATQVRYTLQEADALVPLLGAIAEEIQERRAEQRELARLRDELKAARTPEGLQASLVEIDARLHELAMGLREALLELATLGGSILRLNPLTVHLPGRTRSGEIVFCWQSGEARVGHGHLPGQEDQPPRPLRVRDAEGRHHDTSGRRAS